MAELQEQGDVKQVLAHYPQVVSRTAGEALGNAGGLSGAQIWRVSDSESCRSLCVRRWPRSHPSAECLLWIHRVIGTARTRGCQFLPEVLLNRHGQSMVHLDGYLWEVTTWLPGVASLRDQFTPPKLAAACRALAEFHQATREMAEYVVCDTSPGMHNRLEMTVKCRQQLPQLRDSLRQPLPSPWPPSYQQACQAIVERAGDKLAALEERIRPATKVQTGLQPCLRDIWHQHVLYEHDRLTGIVDFGAMRVDSPALDLARLLGSVALCQEDAWQLGWQAYHHRRPLSAAEQYLAEVACAAAVVLSGLNWVRWLAVEQRRFENLDLVGRRLAECLALLESS